MTLATYETPPPYGWLTRKRKRHASFERSFLTVKQLDLPDAVFKTCPWEPRDTVELGLRQWLRCCAAGLKNKKTIGMPSRAVDEAWHGLILCTARYHRFCSFAYGTYLHHHPAGAAPPGAPDDFMHDQLRRTVIAWEIVARPGEECVLWDLDERLGVDEPWGIDLAHVAMIQAATAAARPKDWK